jgi:hypothetical protein
MSANAEDWFRAAQALIEKTSELGVDFPGTLSTTVFELYRKVIAGAPGAKAEALAAKTEGSPAEKQGLTQIRKAYREKLIALGSSMGVSDHLLLIALREYLREKPELRELDLRRATIFVNDAHKSFNTNGQQLLPDTLGFKLRLCEAYLETVADYLRVGFSHEASTDLYRLANAQGIDTYESLTEQGIAQNIPLTIIRRAMFRSPLDPAKLLSTFTAKRDDMNERIVAQAGQQVAMEILNNLAQTTSRRPVEKIVDGFIEGCELFRKRYEDDTLVEEWMIVDAVSAWQRRPNDKLLLYKSLAQIGIYNNGTSTSSSAATVGRSVSLEDSLFAGLNVYQQKVIAHVFKFPAFPALGYRELEELHSNLKSNNLHDYAISLLSSLFGQLSNSR